MHAPRKPAKGFIGQSVKRVEDPKLIRGIGTYVDDMKFAGMLHCVIVRSPHAHARITAIRTDAARLIPGVIGVFAGKDVNPKTGTVPCGSPMPDMKFAARSWNAKPSARPTMPAPAKIDVSALSKLSTPSAIINPAKRIANLAIVATRP